MGALRGSHPPPLPLIENRYFGGDYMDKETAVAINNLTKRINEVERKLESYFLSKHEENASSIEINDGAIQELAELVSAMTPEE